MNNLQIIYAVEVAERGSVSKAAETLYVSQPAVSHQIMKLEEELGFKIFNRLSHGVVLTENGKVFYCYAKKVLQHWNELVAEMRMVTAGQKRKPLNIWLGPSLYSSGAAEEIMRMTDNRFDVECSFHSSFEASENLYTDISSQKYDIAIDRLQPTYMAGEINKFYISEIAREPVYVMLGRGHALVGKKGITVADLTPYEPISFKKGSGIDNVQMDIKLVPNKAFMNAANFAVTFASAKAIALRQGNTTLTIGINALPRLSAIFFKLAVSCMS